MLGSTLAPASTGNAHNRKVNAYASTVSPKLCGKCALDKKSDIRVSLMYQRATLDEWSWSDNGVSFVYGDNTPGKMGPEQLVTFIGVSDIYKFYRGDGQVIVCPSPLNS